MLNYIDFLSPPITLFHLERRTHTSKVGGCSLLIFLTICIVYISYLLFYVVAHSRVTSIFFKKFEFEAGHYSFNSSSIFHFIQIFSPEDGGYFDKYDSRYIRAFTTYVHSNFKDSDLKLYDHWVFDECRKGIDDKDLDQSLFVNVVNFTNGVCIRHYYNSTEQKYYSLEEEGFHWPYLEHGIAQRNNIYLTTIIQKCTNDSIINELFGNCPTQKEIDNYVSQYFGIYLYFTDTQVDPTNYKMPLQKYFQTISTGIGTSQTYVESYIHYSPIKVRTNEGSVFGNNREINSFYFDFNRKGSANNNPKYFTITKYYHLMQNNVQIYQRKYSNIFDLLSEIGGVAQFVFNLFYCVNYMYNRYVIAYDTNSLFFAVKDNQSKELNIHNNSFNNNNCNDINSIQKININNNNNNNLNLDKLHFKKKVQKYSSLQGINNEKKLKLNFLKNNGLQDNKSDLKENTININKRKSENVSIINNKNYYYLSTINLTNNLNKNHFKKHNSIILDANSSGLSLKNNNNFIFNKKDILKTNDKNNKKLPKKREKEKENETINYSKMEKNLYDKIYLSKLSVAKIDHKTLKLKRINNKEKIKSVKDFSFFIFLKYLLYDKKGSTGFLIKFRKHLLSEEHLFKSHIKMILLEKEFNSKNAENTNVFECFNEL